VNASAVAGGNQIDRFVLKSAARCGLATGLVMLATCVAFVAVGYFTDLGGPTLAGMMIVVSAVVCCLGGMLGTRHSRSIRAGALAGVVAGTLAGILVPVAIYALPYVFPEGVRQNPFDEWTRSGAEDRAFLSTNEGRSLMFDSWVGLIPSRAPFLAAVAGFLGFLGAAYSAGTLKEGRSSR
jgi:hypothetical protein